MDGGWEGGREDESLSPMSRNMTRRRRHTGRQRDKCNRICVGLACNFEKGGEEETISRKGTGIDKKEQQSPLPPFPPFLTSDVILEFTAVARTEHVISIALVDLIANFDEVARLKGGALANQLFAVLDVVSHLFLKIVWVGGMGELVRV